METLRDFPAPGAARREPFIVTLVTSIHGEIRKISVQCDSESFSR